MIYPVFRTDLSPERLDSYHTRMREGSLSDPSDYFGFIAVGAAIDLGANPYELGQVPEEPEIVRTYGIVNVSHIMSVSHEAPEEQGELSPERRPYPEDPISLRATGIHMGKRYALAGIYYASNRLIGWMNIMPVQGVYRRLTSDEEASLID